MAYRRHRMSRRHSKRHFRKHSKIHGRNGGVYVMRGGIRF
jgi:hypothetical protein